MSMKPEEIAIGVTVVVVVIAVAAIICSAMHSRSGCASACGGCPLSGAQARPDPAQIATEELARITYNQRAFSPARTHLDHAHYTTPSRLQAPSMKGGAGMSAPPRRTKFWNIQGVNVNAGGYSPHVRDHGDSLKGEWSILRRAHERRQGDSLGGQMARKVQGRYFEGPSGGVVPFSPFNPQAPLALAAQLGEDVGNHGQKLVPDASGLHSAVRGAHAGVGGNSNSKAMAVELDIDSQDGGWGGPFYHKPQKH